MSDLIKAQDGQPTAAAGGALKNAQMELLKDQLAMLDICNQLGQQLAYSNLVPKQYHEKPGDCAVAIMWGSEIGLQPLQSLQNIAVINGNPSLWGDALVAIVKGSGQCEYLETDWDASAQTATVRTRRLGEPNEHVRSYSMAEAQKAGLTGRDTYQKFASRMVSARARAHLLRDVYPDIIKGMKIREVEEDNDDAGIYSQRTARDITPRPQQIETQSSTLSAIMGGNADDKQALHIDTDTGEVRQPPADEKEQVIATYVETQAGAYKSAQTQSAKEAILAGVSKKLANRPEWMESFNQLTSK